MKTKAGVTILAMFAAVTAFAQADPAPYQQQPPPPQYQGAPPQDEGAPAQEQAGIGTFYSSLGAQGEWISVDGGTYAWHPAGVDPGWRPYSDGHWVWTDDGWYWASDEPWAWATYHYGRWYNDDYYGWCWVPGYEWAPSWVEWRYGENCVGWAPLSPYAVYSANWGVHYRRYWATPYSYWSFVDCRYMGYNDIHRYVYRTSENSRFIGRTRTAGSVRYDNGRIVTRGPEREYVEQRGGIQIPRASLTDVRDRGRAGMTRENGGERIGVYRPRIQAMPGVVGGTRPDRVRADDHPMGLDTRGTDIRRIDESRRPPVVRPAEQGVMRDRSTLRQDAAPREMNRQVIRPDRPVRTPDSGGFDTRHARPERRTERSYNAPAPRGGNWSPPQRSFNPGRDSKPSGGRTDAPSGNRGGGGRGGRR